MQLLEKRDVRYLDEKWRDLNGRVKLMPAEEVLKENENDRLVWMLDNAIYTFPTIELIEWLDQQITGRVAMEVCAGNNDIYYHLRIKGTDSKVQSENEYLTAYYSLLGQRPTTPREDVERIDANTAVSRYRPDVVIASYLTRKFESEKGDQEGLAQASIYGPWEEGIIHDCNLYLHVGNVAVHGKKTVLSIEHQELYFPWLVTRSNPQLNRIYAWGDLR